MGWFALKGRKGERTLDEQMRGVAPLLAEAAGKRVLDLGSAEGLIAIEFARAGAAEVYGVDFNEEFVAVGRGLAAGLKVTLEAKRVDELVRAPAPAPAFDVVLALAILHKLNQPRACMKWIAATGARLVAIRLPLGSRGFFRTKHHARPCNVNGTMSRLGFRLDRVLPGPRDELVQHWRR